MASNSSCPILVCRGSDAVRSRLVIPSPIRWADLRRRLLPLVHRVVSCSEPVRQQLGAKRTCRRHRQNDVHDPTVWLTVRVAGSSTKELCRLGTAISGDYSTGAVDQDRIDESEFCDARGDLPDLSSRMGPRVLCPRLELAGVLIDNLQCGHVSPRLRAPKTCHTLNSRRHERGWSMPAIFLAPRPMLRTAKKRK